jgi:hypothetical protein
VRRCGFLPARVVGGLPERRGCGTELLVD